MDIKLTEEQYYPDVMEILKMFQPHIENLDVSLDIQYDINEKTNDDMTMSISFKDDNKTTNIRDKYSNKIYNFRTLIKVATYDCLSAHYEKNMPWGALTGIRPTKLAFELSMAGNNIFEVRNILQERYRVSFEKANLAIKVLLNQKSLDYDENEVCLYINIPFCTSKCSYCSFISAEIDKIKQYVSPYVDCLIKEIKETLTLIYKKHYWVKAIYIGGGTPTSLPLEELDRLLDSLVFPYDIKEFTVEAGRPDTITKEKLDILKKHNVTRISVNPQTFNDAILKKIGRNHTSAQTFEAYKLACNYDFKINMDLIAGLPGDTLKGFKETVNTALELAPDNLTIHTLALKRASEFAIKNEDIFKKPLTEKMIDYAEETIEKSGYEPYYLYRQKNQVGNLENVGYFFGDSKCVFNIDSMEEKSTILACGANAISKRIFPRENRIERHANIKDIPIYIERIDEMIEKKKELFK